MALGAKSTRATLSPFTVKASDTARPSVPSPNGPYYMFTYSDKGGGGIRGLDPTEKPSSVPYINVKNCHVAYEKALAAGAEGVMAPETIMPGTTIATVRAPGGVLGRAVSRAFPGQCRG